MAKKTAAASESAAATTSAKRASSRCDDAKTALRPGDHVRWQTSRGPTNGVVKRKLTKPADVRGHHAAGSPDNPQYLVQSEMSQAKAIHKPAAPK